MAPTYDGGVQSRTNNAGSPGRILIAPGGSHSPKHISWPTIFINLRDHTGEGGGLTNYLQCGSGHHGLTLVITDIG